MKNVAVLSNRNLQSTPKAKEPFRTRNIHLQTIPLEEVNNTQNLELPKIGNVLYEAILIV